MKIEANGWYYSPDHGRLCQILDTQTIWGETVCRVWLPEEGTVVRIPASMLKPLAGVANRSTDSITYAAAAGRVADALTQDVLLAPIESSVIPLPHQIWAVSQATANNRVRYLLADEVGLGKTIEAGLIMRELKLRGMVERTLVIAPKGLVTQWVAEMRLHFNEHFQLVLPEDIKAISRISAVPSRAFRVPGSEDTQLGTRNSQLTTRSPWTRFPQVVAPMDSVKPLDRRRGWSAAQVAEYNRERFEDLISAGWDLVIVDEAHRLGGSTDQIARFKLGQGLSESAPYLLLLSATPHQGKTDAFHRLVSLIDAQVFPDLDSITRERIQPYVIRTEKRQAIDAEGKPLFKPRHTQLAPVAWEERHRAQQLLYAAVTEYVREGYNQAMLQKRRTIGFLMILMQRLVVSSTNAIKTSLERRLEVLSSEAEAPALVDQPETPNLELETYYDMDGQEQIEALLQARFWARQNEQDEVRLLLEAAKRCQQTGPDAKAEALLDWLYQLQSQQGDPDLKVLIFTEFVATQEMLYHFLADRGFSAVCLNGSMDIEARQQVQKAFAGQARILISTDAGGEGLNLQFCHVVINYDIPWNPMRLEQRIGRVDRIGQAHPVRAINLVLEDSVEHRVREVLEEKLAVIFEEFGIDKTGDVLDTAQAGRMFDEVYVEAILHPNEVEHAVDTVTHRLQEQVREARATASVLGQSRDLDPGAAQRLQAHPLPYWVECMTISYLRAHGGQAARTGPGWDLIWPDGQAYTHVVFSGKEAEELPSARRLTLEDPRVRRLAHRLPRFVPGQPIAVVTLPDLTEEVQGIWSLWQIAITTLSPATGGGEWNSRRILPLFLADSGRVLMPTARHIWDRLIASTPPVQSWLDADMSQSTFLQQEKAAEEYGKPIYDGLRQERRARIARQREKASYAFNARRRAIDRVGLPQVRNHRLNLLAQEERATFEQLEQTSQTLPELVPLLMVRVEGGA